MGFIFTVVYSIGYSKEGLLNKALKGMLTPDSHIIHQIIIDPLSKGLICTASVCVIGVCGLQMYKLLNEPTNNEIYSILKDIKKEVKY